MQFPHGAVIALVDGRNLELHRNIGHEASPSLSPMPSPNLDAHNKEGGSGRHSSSANPTGHQIDEEAHAAAATEWLNQQVLGELMGWMPPSARRRKVPPSAMMAREYIPEVGC